MKKKRCGFFGLNPAPKRARRFFLFLLLGITCCRAFSLSALPCYGWFGDSPSVTEKAHRCLSLGLGRRDVTSSASLFYFGVLFGLVHTSMPADDIGRIFLPEQCNIYGLSFQLIAQSNVGEITGGVISGLFSDQEQGEVTGGQVSGVLNRADSVRGAQVSLVLNRVERTVCGVQIGLINMADRVHGVQIGLININRHGWCIPFVNVGFGNGEEPEP